MSQEAKPSHEQFEHLSHLIPITRAEDLSPAQLQALQLCGQFAQGILGNGLLRIQMHEGGGWQKGLDARYLARLILIICIFHEAQEQAQDVHMVHIAARL